MSKMREDLADLLERLLRSQGASFVAFADLSDLPGESHRSYPRGMSIGVALNPVVVASITNGPTKEYEVEYNRVNRLLGELAEAGAEYLRQQGYEALLSAVTQTQLDEKNLATPLPHKTVATRAGVGWIGKCALLVTKKFGSAIRLTTVLTDADLLTAAAMDESFCGDCCACVDVCPAGSPSGKAWHVGMLRDTFFDAFACYRTTGRWMRDRNLTHHICGMCIAVCPWTRRYLEGKAIT
jgi:epoxyqueuosine reductase